MGFFIANRQPLKGEAGLDDVSFTRAPPDSSHNSHVFHADDEI
jgi:hypothetical protein